MRDSVSQTTYNVEQSNSKLIVNSYVKICGIVLVTGLIDASSIGWFDCKLNNMPKPIADVAISFGCYPDWGNPGITANIGPDGHVVIQVAMAFPNKIPWYCVFVCK